MTKIGNIIGKYLFRIIEWMIIGIILFLFAIRTPQFQTFLGKQATRFLSKEMGHTIRIGRIDIPFYNRLTLQDVFAEDGNNDTLLDVHQIKLSVRFLSIALRTINVKSVSLEKGKAYLRRDSIDGKFNYQYLIDYFKSDKKKKKMRPFTIKVGRLSLANFHFKLDDDRKVRIPFGVDYAHLDVKDIFLTMKDVKMKGVDLQGTISHLSFREQSGFVLSRLSTQFGLSQKGMFYDHLQLTTPQTSAVLPKLYFKMKGLKRFRTFVDDVSFDAILSQSKVSMKDVAYFAPRLKGMEEQVVVSATVLDRIKDLKIRNLLLDIRNKTTLSADLQLPDFRKLSSESIRENIHYAYIDLQELNDLKLPIGGSEAQRLNLNEIVQRFGYVDVRDLQTDGTYHDFSVKLKQVYTSIGTAQMNNWMDFIYQGDGVVAFQAREQMDSILKVNDFDLGTLIDNKLFGLTTGAFSLNGSFSKTNGIALENIKGNVSRFTFKEYAYKNIHIDNGTYSNKKVGGEVQIQDDNADLDFRGNLDFNERQSYLAEVDVTHLNLNRLNLIVSDSVYLIQGNLKADVEGDGLSSYHGNIRLSDFCVSQGNREFHAERAILSLLEDGDDNLMTLQSDVLDATLRGKIRYNDVVDEIKEVLAYSLPLLAEDAKKQKMKAPHSSLGSKFDFRFNLKAMNPILNMFVADMRISNGTKVFGDFSSLDTHLDLTLQSPELSVGKLRTKNVNLTHDFSQTGATLRYTMSQFYLNDSISPFESFIFVAKGTTDDLNSYVRWGKKDIDLSNIRWKSTFRAWDDFTFTIDKSLFTLNTHDWVLPRETSISYQQGDWLINDFELTHEDQYITIDGEYSKKEGKDLDICVSNLELKEVTSIFSLEMEIQGIANGEFHLSNEFNSFQFYGNTTIDKLVLNQIEVGDLNFIGRWNKPNKAIAIDGELIFRQNKTFNIHGNYYTARKKNNLDFVLDFDHTKIDFLNVFMDPEVISNIRGELTGNAHVKGELNNLSVEGSVNLEHGNVKVGMFGVNYGFSGKVNINNDLIYFDNLPLLDEKGSRGMLTGSILHDHFKNFNFDVFIGLDDVVAKDGTNNVGFLAMNTGYQDGTIYYGKAFVNGWVGIGGYLDNLNVEVNLKTRKNTSVVIPMYGAEEVDDILSYHIKHSDTLKKHDVSDANKLSVRLNLNFDLNPDASIKLVFDEQTEEEIAATGNGNISIRMSKEMPLSMQGNYVIDQGYYNFVYNPIRKRFLVEKGSSITWHGGGPTEADLNIRALYKVNTDVSTISPELESSSSSSSTQNVDAVINVKGDLEAPQLSFELNAPSASESVKAQLDRINSDNDELNKQFFMLLLTGHFQAQNAGISGIGNGGTNAALEAISGQINNLLDAVSKDVRLNVDLRSDDLSGKNSQAIGFKTGLLNNKLIIKGNVGVENNTSGSDQRNTSFIGDLSLEYVIDNAGNFTVKVFNESNSFSAIQDKELGMFTQGIGLVYSESFNKFKNTNFANFIADFFRRNKYFEYTKRRRKTLLPEFQNNAIIEEKKYPDEN